jgi:endonuclease/exonuclease/phosphatase (EEP) superfamily protein YafD
VLFRSKVKLHSGIEAEVLSVHLESPEYRRDFRHLGYWHEQAQRRRIHRKQMEEVVWRIQRLAPETPIIVGGDFNAPACDGIFRLLRSRLQDTFAQAGIGWGNTIFNHRPVLRIDQIWVNDRFRPAVVVVRESKYSDHRMVICDLIIKK